MTRIVLVTNPSSGSADSECLEEISVILGSLGEVVLCEPQSVEDFDASVSEVARNAEEVVVAGGDGTMNLTVNALERHLDGLVLGLIPMGTGNDLARTLGLSFDPVRAATAIARGTVRAIDLGVATGAECRRLFTNACIGGFPVAVNQAIDPDTKRRLGPAAFLVGGAKAATELDRSLVRIDDVEVPDCVAAGVGNGRTAGGGIEVWPSAVPDDGVLNGCALGAPGRAAALKLAGLMRHGAHERLEHVATSAGPRITLHSDPPIEVNCDGELIGLRTPATFEIAGRLRVRT